MTAQLTTFNSTLENQFPTEVRLILSALEAAGNYEDRRETERLRFRVEATLKLFADGPDENGRLLYTRDVSQRGIGFITRYRLPLGYGGNVCILTPQGGLMTVPCVVLRCRQVSSGYFEGSLYFNREQFEFGAQDCTMTQNFPENDGCH
jgi:hypothetical protein